MAVPRLSFTRLLITFLFLSIALVLVHAASQDEEAATKDTGANSQVEDDNDDIAAQIAAEEAAAAVEEEALEEEEDDEADALDEDADSARYDPELKHPLSELPPSSKDINIGYSFINGLSSSKIKTKQGEDEEKPLITLGEKVKTIIAVSNEGRSKYHIWGIIGSLNRDKNFNVHIQNFTYSLINHTINVDEELSFTYEFTPNDRLDVRPFQLAITVFYEARSTSSNKPIRGHSTTFYNQTVLTQPGPQIISNSLFMIFFFIFIAAIVTAFYVWNNYIQQQENQKDKSISSSKDSKSRKLETGTSDSSKNEWLEDHLGMTSSGGGRAKRKAKDKKQ